MFYYKWYVKYKLFFYAKLQNYDICVLFFKFSEKKCKMFVYFLLKINKTFFYLSTFNRFFLNYSITLYNFVFWYII